MGDEVIQAAAAALYGVPDDDVFHVSDGPEENRRYYLDACIHALKVASIVRRNPDLMAAIQARLRVRQAEFARLSDEVSNGVG